MIAEESSIKKLKTEEHQEKEPENDLLENDSLIEERIVKLKDQIVLSRDKISLQASITDLQKEIATTSKSMTSIPKPLKFIHPFFTELRQFYDNYENQSEINVLVDILSCVAMVIEDKEKLYCLNYKLKSGNEDISLWGHEYVKHLSREIIMDYSSREEQYSKGDQTRQLIEKIIEYDFNNRVEIEAVDLLLEVDLLEMLIEKTDEESAKRVCSYLLSCQQYIPAEISPSPKIFETTLALHLKYKQYDSALKVAFISHQPQMIERCFTACEDQLQKSQLALIAGTLARRVEHFRDDESQLTLLGNEGLSKWFEWLAKELSVSEPKQIEDIYKSHLIDRSTFKKYENSENNETSKEVSSAKENLAATFVNALVHVGFGSDALVSPEDSDWVYKNKGTGISSAAASLGLIHLWDLENGFQAVDRLAESSNLDVKAGALLGFGLVGCCIKSELDASSALLLDHLEGESDLLKLFAIIGLGISSVNTAETDLIEALDPIISDYSKPDLSAFACLSLGLVFLGTCEDAAVEGILGALIHFSSAEASEGKTLMMSVGLALIFMGSNEKSEGIYEALDVLGEHNGEIAKALVFAFAHAGSGNVLHFHKTLKKIKTICEEKASSDKNKKEESPLKQQDKKLASAISVIGLAMIAIGEKLGKNMSYRIFDDLLRYEDIQIRRAVPLGLALLFASKPDYSVVQLLSKLSHDPDETLSLNAIMALGLVSAGTNNSRVAKILRNLAVYYHKDPDHLLITRISQGLVHCGKGLMTLNPHHLDETVLNENALAGFVIVLISCIDIKNSILSDKHYILFYLALTIRPRMLITVDENMLPLSVPVRVGQAVDNVRLAGKSKTITGFQTHQTPVLLAGGEKAELATKKYTSLASYLEGVVILRKNLDYEGEEETMEDE